MFHFLFVKIARKTCTSTLHIAIRVYFIAERKENLEYGQVLSNSRFLVSFGLRKPYRRKMRIVSSGTLLDTASQCFLRKMASVRLLIRNRSGKESLFKTALCSTLPFSTLIITRHHSNNLNIVYHDTQSFSTFAASKATFSPSQKENTRNTPKPFYRSPKDI